MIRYTYDSLRKTTAKVIQKRILNQVGLTHVLMSVTTSSSDYAELASSQVDHKEFLSSIPAHCLSKKVVSLCYFLWNVRCAESGQGGLRKRATLTSRLFVLLAGQF